ncbi:MAG: CpaF family protein [Candidatus Omnitrophica bacterium]|nr:CpaF family protein [Candidatus Omnitrophota bacterium]
MLNNEIRDMVNHYLIKETDFLKVKDAMNEDQLRKFVDDAIVRMCNDRNLALEKDQRAAVIRDMVSAVMSMGPLRPVMEDKTISEIMINGPHQIYIQRNGHISRADIKFENAAQLQHTIQKILAASGSNKRVDESLPYVDFMLKDGSRVNVILPPCSLVGPVMTVRKFNDAIGTVDDLLNRKMLDKQIATLLIAAMKAKFNIVFCGSTGSGKTTMLNVFSRHIPAEERIVTIEDTPELRLLQEHVVPLISKPANIEGRGEITMQELFINSLRMRPDRIIIGEVRGPEMLDLIQSISSGHSGSLAIVHAETPEDCFNRMVLMMMMAGIQLSTEEIRKQVARAIDIVVHVELFFDGYRRVTAITDLTYDEEKQKVMLHDVFRFEQKGVKENGEIIGEWVMDRRRPSFYNKFKKRMVTLPQGFFDESLPPLKGS